MVEKWVRPAGLSLEVSSCFSLEVCSSCCHFPRFERIREHYYLDANAALIVFDQTRQETFDHLQNWLNDLDSHCGTVPTLILANKNDLPDKAVTGDSITQFSSSKSLEVLKTSAKTGENVDKIFDTIARHCLETYD